MPRVMPQRTAPASGYDTPAKAGYREDCYKFLLEGRDPKLLKCLIMPSLEGLEIPLLLKAGIKEENILAVDANPDVLLEADWRKLHPDVECYPYDVGIAFTILANKGVSIDVANIDLCSCLSKPYIRIVENIRDSGALADKARIAFTMQKGREKIEKITENYESEWIEAVGERHNFVNILLRKKYRVTPLAHGWYSNRPAVKYARSTEKSAPMTWQVVELTKDTGNAPATGGKN